jgi:hypothetical protein
MWKLDDWGIFFICTLFLMPIGIILLVMSRHEKKLDDKLEQALNDIDRNRYISKDVIEEFR